MLADFRIYQDIMLKQVFQYSYCESTWNLDACQQWSSTMGTSVSKDPMTEEIVKFCEVSLKALSGQPPYSSQCPPVSGNLEDLSISNLWLAACSWGFYVQLFFSPQTNLVKTERYSVSSQSSTYCGQPKYSSTFTGENKERILHVDDVDVVEY